MSDETSLPVGLSLFIGPNMSTKASLSTGPMNNRGIPLNNSWTWPMMPGLKFELRFWLLGPRYAIILHWALGRKFQVTRTSGDFTIRRWPTLETDAALCMLNIMASLLLSYHPLFSAHGRPWELLNFLQLVEPILNN
ncbi:unnamed protein product [Prunus armeniaca]